MPEEAIAALDSCVILDIYSCHDLKRALGGHCESYRKQRARESLLLAMYFEQEAAITYSIGEAKIRMLEIVSPTDGDPYEVLYPTVVSHCDLFPRWVSTLRLEDDEANEPSSNRADAALVEYARNYSIPLITNEGYTLKGIDETKYIRRLAQQAGVQVLTPEQFYVGKLDETAAINSFFRAYDQKSRECLLWHSQREELIQEVRAYFQCVLQGS